MSYYSPCIVDISRNWLTFQECFKTPITCIGTIKPKSFGLRLTLEDGTNQNISSRSYNHFSLHRQKIKSSFTMISLISIRTQLTKVLNFKNPHTGLRWPLLLEYSLPLAQHMGLHTLSAVFLAWAFRLNYAAILLGNFVNNPWTTYPNSWRHDVDRIFYFGHTGYSHILLGQLIYRSHHEGRHAVYSSLCSWSLYSWAFVLTTCLSLSPPYDYPVQKTTPYFQ